MAWFDRNRRKKERLKDNVKEGAKATGNLIDFIFEAIDGYLDDKENKKSGHITAAKKFLTNSIYSSNITKVNEYSDELLVKFYDEYRKYIKDPKLCNDDIKKKMEEFLKVKSQQKDSKSSKGFFGGIKEMLRKKGLTSKQADLVGNGLENFTKEEGVEVEELNRQQVKDFVETNAEVGEVANDLEVTKAMNEEPEEQGGLTGDNVNADGDESNVNSDDSTNQNEISDSDKKSEEKEQGDDTEDNEDNKDNKKSTLDKVKGALGTVKKGAVTAGGAVVGGAKAAGKAIGKKAGAVRSAVSTGVGNLSKKLSHKKGKNEPNVDGDGSTNQNDSFAEMKTKYDEFVEEHNKFLQDHGTGPIEKVFKDNPGQEYTYNKNAWLKEAASLNPNKETEIEKYQELADKILNYCNGSTKSDYQESINGSINYYKEAKDQAGKAEAIKSIEESLNNLFLQFGAVHKWFLEDGVGDKVENVTESNKNEAEEQKEEGALHKAKRVVGDAGDAVVEKGKAAGRGAKTFGNALLDKASGLKRAVGKKLKRKKSTPEAATPQASAPEASTNAVIPQEDAKKVTKEDVKKQLLKVVNRYNRFLEDYKKFAKKNKHSLEEILKSVLPSPYGEYHWGKKVINEYKEFKIDESKLDDYQGIKGEWERFSEELFEYVPPSNAVRYRQIFKDIENKVSSTEDFETLLNEYNLPAKKILRYMQGVLARLNSTASEGIVGRALKAMTKDDEGTREQEGAQEQKPRNLEDDLIIGKDVDGKFIEPASEVDTGDIFTAFKNAGDVLKNSKNDGIKSTTDLISKFEQIKGFKGAIKSALGSASILAWGPPNFGNDIVDQNKRRDKKMRVSAMGVILISMAYLPGGSESILEACKGLKAGGIKANSGDSAIENAHKVRKEIKKLALKGATGDELVNKLKSSNAKASLEYLIDINALKKIMNKFGKLGKFSRTKFGGAILKVVSPVKKKAGDAKDYVKDKKDELKKKYKGKSIKEIFKPKKKDAKSGEGSQSENV